MENSKDALPVVTQIEILAALRAMVGDGVHTERESLAMAKHVLAKVEAQRRTTARIELDHAESRRRRARFLDTFLGGK